MLVYFQLVYFQRTVVMLHPGLLTNKHHSKCSWCNLSMLKDQKDSMYRIYHVPLCSYCLQCLLFSLLKLKLLASDLNSAYTWLLFDRDIITCPDDHFPDTGLYTLMILSIASRFVNRQTGSNALLQIFSTWFFNRLCAFPFL